MSSLPVGILNRADMCPRWVEPMLELEANGDFFKACSVHKTSPKNMCSYFCVNCASGGGSLCCPSCLVEHRDHSVLQIRRCSGHNAVRVTEIHKLIDIFGIQAYTIHGAEVVFLNERPFKKKAAEMEGVTTATCEGCHRPLMDPPRRFCSLGCKLKGMPMSDPHNITDGGSGPGGSSKIYICPENNSHRRKGIPRRAPFY